MQTASVWSSSSTHKLTALAVTLVALFNTYKKDETDKNNLHECLWCWFLFRVNIICKNIHDVGCCLGCIIICRRAHGVGNSLA